MPPAFRNHRAPIACGTPAAAPASSLDKPAAIAAQNCRRSSRPATGGRPGDGRGFRPDRPDRRFRMVIANASVEVLRRPLESALAAAIRVVREPGIGPPVGDRHAQRRQGQFPRHGRRHGPADHLAGKQVQHDGQVEPALLGRHVGDVGQPDLVWCCCRELPCQQVGRQRQGMVAVGRGPEPPPAPGPDAMPPHQAGDPVTPHPAALGLERGMHPGAAIAAPAVGMDAADGVDQHPVAAGTGAFGTATPVATSCGRRSRGWSPGSR
jgi:hypothetical protein